MLKARTALHKKNRQNVVDEHGNQDADPTWPGGAQMKFISHLERNMIDSNKAKNGRRAKMHTTMKGNFVMFTMDIKDPTMKLDCFKEKTV